MEAAPARDPAHRASPAALLREPLFWAASAAFACGALRLVGTFVQAAVVGSYTPSMSTVLFADVAQYSAVVLAALSLLGVPSLLGGLTRTAGSQASLVGGVLLLLLLAASTTSVLLLWYMNTGDRAGTIVQPPRLLAVSFWASPLLSSAVTLPFALAAFVGRKARLGGLLLGLCVLNLPFGMLSSALFPPDIEAYYEPSATPVLFGWYGWGVRLPEAPLWALLGATPLWALLGATLFREARERAYGRVELLEREENRQKAHRLYEEGLGRGDFAVVDEIVSEDFRDLRHGYHGKFGMERILRSLWESFPDLTVCVEGQEAQDDLVRTRLLLSGTDRGSGMLWYPPTGRRVAFSATFEDRFSEGRLVEHGGSTDTEGLLRKLGRHEDYSPDQ